MPLPEYFCWTRFGTEAGQPVNHILARKERERAANAGLFIWGIGNAIGPSIRELVRRTTHPEVLFSPIRSAPKSNDVSPPAVAAWVSGEGLDGTSFLLPEHSVVTSRFDPQSPRSFHYALVCFSEQSLTASHCVEKVHLSEMTNLLTGRPIGASQVTAVVQPRMEDERGQPNYPVAIRASLAYPYFIRLRNPVILPESAKTSGTEWIEDAFRMVREHASRERIPTQLRLDGYGSSCESENSTPASLRSLRTAAAACVGPSAVESTAKQGMPHAIA